MPARCTRSSSGQPRPFDGWPVACGISASRSARERLRTRRRDRRARAGGARELGGNAPGGSPVAIDLYLDRVDHLLHIEIVHHRRSVDDGYLDHVLLLSPREMCGASMEELPQAGRGRHQQVRTRTAHRTCRAPSSDGSGLAASIPGWANACAAPARAPTRFEGCPYCCDRPGGEEGGELPAVALR